MDCSQFYKNGKLRPWNIIPGWYVLFLSTSPPDEEMKEAAERELERRGYK